MTSNSKQEILEILGIDQNEIILEEFTSFLMETIPILGNLYITEHYICFYSNIFFFNRNISIPINEITKINNNNGNVEITSKNKIYLFFSKEQINIIYEKIASICHLYNNNYKLKNGLVPILIINSEKESKINESSILSQKESLKNKIDNINEEIKFDRIDPDIDFEICKKIIDISPKDLFNKYYSNSNCFVQFYEWLGDHSNIKISDWEKIECNETSEIEKFKKTEKFSISLKGVPLVDHSEVAKSTTYYVRKDGSYHINDISKSEGIPFSDCFNIESKIELYPYINGTKTVFRTYVRTNFFKYTMFKSLIISQTKKSYSEEINKWFDYIQEKGEMIDGDYIYINKKIDNLVDKLNNNNDEEKITIINESKIEKKEKIYSKVYKRFINVYNIIYEKMLKRISKSSILLLFLLLYLLLLIIIIYEKKWK